MINAAEINGREVTMANNSPLKILVVDSQPENVDNLKTMLTEWGYEVLKSQKGLDAIGIAREKKPDLVLLNVMMPDVTGYEVCRALRIFSETSDIPVIFLTAKGELFDHLQDLDVGSYDYITRPYNPDELQLRIRKAIRHKEEKEKLRQETAALKAQSIIDELTGFYNRRYLEERLQEELARASRYHYPLSLALVSPDGFDEIRRLYSRARGDSIISQVGDIMKRNIRAIDIVTRFDDITYAVILPQTGSDGAEVFGRKISRIIERHLFYGIPDKTRISAGVGIALYEPEVTGSIETLINGAMEALKQVNADGGNAVLVNRV